MMFLKCVCLFLAIVKSGLGSAGDIIYTCRSDKYSCGNGICITADKVCNGVIDCSNGIDEFLCGEITSSAAISSEKGSTNDVAVEKKTADNIDEANTSQTNQTRENEQINPIGGCDLPPKLEHGTYFVSESSKVPHGQGYSYLHVSITCAPGYGTVGSNIAYCFKGTWIIQMPKCTRLCKLKRHNSVEYKCILTGNNQGYRFCEGYEPHGTQVEPICRAPNYYSPTGLKLMTCIDGSWNYVATCVPECGKVTPQGEKLILDGWSAKHGDHPWHVGIYRKTENPYVQICGGTLVTQGTVISAAHCFWNDQEKIEPAENYALGVGKIYWAWNHLNDQFGQKSDVKQIIISSLFYGAATNFVNDISLLIVERAFEYKPYVRPICLDFDSAFEKFQLQNGKLGKIAGWGLTEKNGNASPVLKVTQLPYFNIETCLKTITPSFKEYITNDKFCAGYSNGTTICKGDSGGGLAFLEFDRSVERHYLRGIASTAPSNEDLCNPFAITSFTRINSHEQFIKTNILYDE
uniref:Serine protease 1 n=1 Tax=Lonomia obliqua TaxID=304329 RepID=Q5MGG8_LONON|nr:serine protease 1 [Lonomia obliqua]